MRPGERKRKEILDGPRKTNQNGSVMSGMRGLASKLGALHAGLAAL